MSTPLAERGFIQVRCPTCKNPDVWFKCNQCGKSDHFARHDDHIDCDCGGRYDHGTCTCGQAVPMEHLESVAYDKGPLALADLEFDTTRAVVLGLMVLVVLGLIAYAVLL